MLQPDVEPMLRETGLKPLEIPLGNLPSGSAKAQGKCPLIVHSYIHKDSKERCPVLFWLTFSVTLTWKRTVAAVAWRELLVLFSKPGHVTDHYDCQRFLSNWYTKS